MLKVYSGYPTNGAQRVEGGWQRLEILSSIVESFPEVTILRLGWIPKHCSIISNSDWKTSQKFGRFTCCYILHWGIKSQKREGEG